MTKVTPPKDQDQSFSYHASPLMNQRGASKTNTMDSFLPRNETVSMVKRE